MTGRPRPSSSSSTLPHSAAICKQTQFVRDEQAATGGNSKAKWKQTDTLRAPAQHRARVTCARVMSTIVCVCDSFCCRLRLSASSATDSRHTTATSAGSRCKRVRQCGQHSSVQAGDWAAGRQLGTFIPANATAAGTQPAACTASPHSASHMKPHTRSSTRQQLRQLPQPRRAFSSAILLHLPVPIAIITFVWYTVLPAASLAVKATMSLYPSCDTHSCTHAAAAHMTVYDTQKPTRQWHCTLAHRCKMAEAVALLHMAAGC